MVLVAIVGRLSWWQRFLEIKFLAAPESRRACTGMETSEAVSITIVVSGCVLAIDGLITLTMGRGGRIGHAMMTCPTAPQYKHKLWVSHLCRSA